MNDEELTTKFMKDIEPIMEEFVKAEGIAMLIVVDETGFQIRSNLNTEGQLHLLIDTFKTIKDGGDDAQVA